MEKQIDSCHSQKLVETIDKFAAKHTFSACSVGYSIFADDKYEYNEGHVHYGFTETDGKGKRVDGCTFYDLASLTKPLVTSLVILSLIDKGAVALDDTLSKFFEHQIPGGDKIEIHHLLNHSSGLPAHKEYFTELMTLSADKRKEALLRNILKEELLFQPGSSVLYSDLGFILLGCLIERITQISLAAYWRTAIAIPLGVENMLKFNSFDCIDTNTYAVTGSCPWSYNKLRGVVHDDNCRSLGGVAGHAGLFGTLSGVLILCKEILLSYKGERSKKVLFNLGQFIEGSGQRGWVFGFDTPSKGYTSSGTYFSKKTIGHLGFSGTSFWIDLEQDIAVVLLTNRVIYQGNAEKMREFRPIIHDAIMKMIKKP